MDLYSRRCLHYLEYTGTLVLGKNGVTWGTHRSIRTATPIPSAMGEPLAADESISVSAARLRGTASCHKSVAPETHADGLLGRVPFSKSDFEGVWLRLAARLGHFVTPSVARYPAPFVRHFFHFFASHPPIPTKAFIWAYVYLCVECMSCYMHILLTLHVLCSCSPVGWTAGRSSIRRVSAGGRLARLYYVKRHYHIYQFHYSITTTTGRYLGRFFKGARS